MKNLLSGGFSLTPGLTLAEKQVEHFRTLDFDLKGKKILELGSGPLGEYTEYLLEEGGIVTSMPMRKEHLADPRQIETLVGKIERDAIEDVYDCVFSLDDLYQSSEHEELIEGMAERAKNFLLISTLVNSSSVPETEVISEGESNFVRDVNEVARLPSREWIAARLRKYFPYVLLPRTQPDHPDFAKDWSKLENYSGPLRFIIVGTRSQEGFSSGTWSEELLERQSSVTYLVSAPQKDGFGAQYQKKIMDIAYSKQKGYAYLWTPLTAMEHNYNSEDGFLEQAERSMGLKEHFARRPIVAGSFVQSDRAIYDIVNNDVENYFNERTRKYLRKIFWKNKPPKDLIFQNHKVNVGVHVRRPNPHDCRLEGADASDDTYMDIIAKIRKLHDGESLLFHIYSQGRAEDFKAFRSSDIVMHLNESPFDTFTALVASDIIVTSRSSFSYTAALLSKGEVHYLKFWCTGLRSWISH